LLLHGLLPVSPLPAAHFVGCGQTFCQTAVSGNANTMKTGPEI
jgi:hypothetical protein